jgi:DHA1 family inner membrane transport protein
MNTYLPRITLMLGNVFIGLAVLGPAGMMAPMARGLHVGIHDIGLLVTYGAVVLCIGSPLIAWLTTRVDRRTLLVATLALVAVFQAASGLAPKYAGVLVLRLLLAAAVAVYTPQAAATVALIVPERERASAIAVVFLGWSVAIAGGLPLVTFIATHFGWRAVFSVLGAASLLGALLIYVSVPSGLQGRPLSLKSFGVIARNSRIVIILAITLIQTAGQFTVFVYMAPLLKGLAGAGPAVAGTFFAAFGAFGLIGNIIASAIVTRLGAQRTLALFLLSTFAGLLVWAVGAGSLMAMGAGVVLWALGFSAVNSMQQARLAAAAPDLASASIALNSSMLYVAQAAGSAIGGLLYATDHLLAAGYVATALVVVGGALLAVSWERETPPAPASAAVCPAAAE